jgi:N-acetylglucosaminyl-diphospho-decaprenol L-rhamnosyltransferase
MPAVVVLTYRPTREALTECLTSVVDSGDADMIIVVDNGRTLTEASFAQAGFDQAGVTLLTPERNLGYAGGMNLGIRRASGLGASWVALLNDDTRVEPGWLTVLEAAITSGDADHRRIGAVQPKLLLSGTSPAQVNSVGVRWRRDGAGIDVGYGEIDRGQFDHRTPIDLFTGGAVMVSTAFIDDLGGFDERYFMYYEDIDLALRGTARGWSYLVEPAAVVHHAVGGTSKSMPAQRRYWQERNRLWCLFRHGTVTNIARGLVLSALRLGRHPSRAQASAIIAGLQSAPRMIRERRTAP